MTTTINASTSSGLVNTADTSGVLQLQTANTAAVTIDASQNVTIAKPVALSGSTSGAITLAAPAVAGTNTITFPASTGTVVTTGSPQSGSIIQVVGANNTMASTTITSTSFVSTGLTATITPRFSNSKIYIVATFSMTQDGQDNAQAYVTIYRNGSTDLKAANPLAMYDTPGGDVGFSIPITYYDSPATTSATSYTVYGKVSNASSQFRPRANTDTIILMEIAA
jgi:hypothetical protein